MTNAPIPLPALWPEASDRLVESLRKRLKPKRFRHVLGVLQTALSLAESHRIDSLAVGWAALLHDIAKCDDLETLPEVCERLGELIPEEDLPHRGLWHAWAAAGEARRDWGIEDDSVLEALRFHSTGSPGMGPVAKILVLADGLEPSRGLPERWPLLAVAHRDLDEALRQLLQAKCEHVVSGGMEIHPRAQQTLESLAVQAPPEAVAAAAKEV
jgi:predicted HD superfamily hydrolase involved in NAD metabolism